MMLPEHGLQAAQRQVRVNLRGRNVGVAQQQLHAAQVGAVLHHVCGATVAQRVRTGLAIRQLYQVPHPLARQRHAAQRKKHACAINACGVSLACRTDSRQVRPAFIQIRFQSFQCGAAQRHNAFLVAFAAHLHPARVERQVAGGERGNL